MQKIKVLHIIKSLGRGGAEVLLPETLALHNDHLFDFHYVYFLPWKNQMVQAIESEGGKVACFSANNNFQMLRQYSNVITYCIKNNIDIIHCHLPWSGFLGRLVFAKTKIPVIYTEHNIQERYHKITKWLNKVSFNSQSLAVGVSEDVTDSIIKNINPCIPIRTVLNGVNTANFKHDIVKKKEIKNQLGIPEDSTVIGNIAVFREQKALLDWVKAFKEVSIKCPNVYGLLVGAGPKGEEIEQLIKDLELTERIKLPGLQTNTIGYFSSMDVFMMSSAFEGLPIALLEAMSMKCAIVSTKAGGVVEAIRDGIDGLLCEVGDYKGLAKRAEGLVIDIDRRRDLQIAARKRVKESFSLAMMVSKLEDIYIHEANSVSNTKLNLEKMKGK